MSAFMLIQKSPQRSRLEFLRASTISLKGSVQLSFNFNYKLIYTLKQENTLGQYNIRLEDALFTGSSEKNFARRDIF